MTVLAFFTLLVISAVDRDVLATQVCLGEVTAVVAEDTAARVECAPHTTMAGLPALRVARCERESRRWRCGQPVLAVRTGASARHIVLSPLGISFETAFEIARTLAEHPYTFNGRNLAGMLQGYCTVADLGVGAFAGARDYRLRCGSQGAVVTRACAEGACRLFPARWDDA